MPNREQRRAGRTRTKRARSVGTYRWKVSPGDKFDELAKMIGAASAHVFDGSPTEIIGSAEKGSGRIRGLKATYGACQTVTVRIRKDGSYSVSFGLRLVTKVSQ
ncbi:hypothetical protein [Sphingopyxis sp. GW247-27LB]|uniref:hypothetical protein n=1 Tax=Sphingopyxis sp. GW247-27LB TaxID=2012632 RepID=UPI001140E7AC|nr:hypothetical protein [Sphingopyxis sp. GW247-27LB]